MGARKLKIPKTYETFFNDYSIETQNKKSNTFIENVEPWGVLEDTSKLRKQQHKVDSYILEEPSRFYSKQKDTGAEIMAYAESLATLEKVVSISQKIAAFEKKIEIYKTENTVYSKVIEITEHFVLGSCMINEVERKVKRVRYNKDVLSELDLKEGDIIEVKVFTKPGEIKSTYTKNTKFDVAKKFEWERNEEDPFKDIDFSKFIQPLPSEI